MTKILSRYRSKMIKTVRSKHFWIHHVRLRARNGWSLCLLSISMCIMMTKVLNDRRSLFDTWIYSWRCANLRDFNDFRKNQIFLSIFTVLAQFDDHQLFRCSRFEYLTFRLSAIRPIVVVKANINGHSVIKS